ncbi:ABC transporter permease subunit [Paenibacillus donghaensis]|uniref:ABC transporter permease n=1 Tax=Paenibacillus donghaensis TaxID=414771 RepID=UPI001883FCCF|nr:ABC transporter permease [Paenibacillus donghaensis]MBE9916051.1 ABC transporter permease subunit [Paenibacillus donghaensis]
MRSFVGSEWLKYRRTLTPWLVVAGPFIFALMQMVFGLLIPGGVDWSLALMNIYNWWSGFGLPFGIILLTALSVSYERKAGAWRLLRAYPVKGGNLYFSKFIVIALQTLIACIFLGLFIILLCSWSVTGTIPWGPIALGITISWLTSLAQIAFMLWAAHMFGFGLTILIGLAGMICGILQNNRIEGWMLLPWQWPLRALGALFGFQTNGMPLDPSSPLLDNKLIITAIIASLSVCVALSVAGAAWFKRREVQ